MDSGATGSHDKARKRAPKACRRCRRQKIKCTGARPCEPCSKRNLACQFDDYAQKVLVTRGYISELEKRVASFERQADRFPDRPSILDEQETPGASGDSDAEDEEDETIEVDEAPPQQPHVPNPTLQPIVQGGSSRAASTEPPLMNPLISNSYFADTSGRPIYLGTSSNWSFGRRVLAMTHERVTQSPLSPQNLLFEGKSYDLGWDGERYLPPAVQATAPALPSADFAMYLINAVKFHCGQIFHLFDEDKFMRRFSQFQEHSQQAVGSESLWYIHYLLILAFGKAFLGHGNKGKKPPGAELFVHAMRLLPDLAFHNADPIESIQVLCCAALYLHCLDYRGAAYRIIGQALRMALENGMHTEMHSQQIDRSLVQSSCETWWTVYILDRQMSSLMGVPMGISDDSITAALPNIANHPQRSLASNIQIKLSRVLAQILNTVYGAEGRLDKRFLLITKDALKKVATVTDQLSSSFAVLGDGATFSISRLSTYLHLLYHQCIVLTTRPLLFGFLESKLGQSRIKMNEMRRSGSVRKLLQMCIESAQQMLLILTAVQDHGLLESFLPFDLDATFTSTIALLMAATVDPSLIKEPAPWLNRAFSVLDEMISRGNMVAKLTKIELQQLQDILNRLPPNGDGDTQRGRGAPANRQSSLAVPEQSSGQTLAASSGDKEPPPPYMTLQPTGDDFQMDEFTWQDGFTAEQLVNFADSMDLGDVDWLSAGTGT